MFHYTTKHGWKEMNSGSDCYFEDKNGKYLDGETFRGLKPNRRLISQGPESFELDKEATKPALFGFLEPEPESWISYRDPLNIWHYLLSGIGARDNWTNLILLKVDLVEEDEPYVVEQFCIRKMAKELESVKEKLACLRNGYKNYWDSRIRLQDYKGNYVLPEVFSWNTIPLERIHFEWEKPYDELMERFEN